MKDYKDVIVLVLEVVVYLEFGVVKEMKEIDVVGYRVVYVGEKFVILVVIILEVEEVLKECIDLVLFYNLVNIMGIDVCKVIFLDVLMVGVFDIVFY